MARSMPHRLPPPPRSESLIKVYLVLLAIGILLCGALAHRRIVAFFGGADVVQITTETRDPSVPQRYYGPIINWGGSKR
jgi:hypothetical protein